MKTFLLNMISAGDNVSSKRVIGIGCVIIYIIFVILNFFISLSEIQLKMLDTLFWGGCTLLGATVLEKGIKQWVVEKDSKKKENT